MEANPLKVYQNVVDAIGCTPMIKLNWICKDFDIDCQIFAKCENFNMGGSIKDRVAIQMIEEAEKRGLIKPGFTLVKSTSGNTGIGLALACIVKGYKLIITIPDKMSDEKINLLKAMGAELFVTSAELNITHPDSYISIARRLGAEPNHYWIN